MVSVRFIILLGNIPYLAATFYSILFVITQQLFAKLFYLLFSSVISVVHSNFSPSLRFSLKCKVEEDTELTFSMVQTRYLTKEYKLLPTEQVIVAVRSEIAFESLRFDSKDEHFNFPTY
jgi:hypothetical protein